MDMHDVRAAGGEIEHLIDAARDALTDEMVGRLAETMSSGLSLLDRLERGGADRMIALLERLDGSGSLQKLCDSLPALVERMSRIEATLAAIDAAAQRASRLPPSRGGLRATLDLLRDPQFQDALRFLREVGKALRETTQVPPPQVPQNVR